MLGLFNWGVFAVYWWPIFALLNAELVILLHECSHAVCILLSGRRVMEFKPWPHVSSDSFGRRYFWFGRAHSGTQNGGPFWEPVTAFAPFVSVGLALLALGTALLVEGLPETQLARAVLLTGFGWCAVDRFWGFLQGALGRPGDLRAGSVDLGWDWRRTERVGAGGAAVVALWTIGVGLRVVLG